MTITFHTPGHQATRDLTGSNLSEYQNLWNQNLIGWTRQSVDGNPWSNNNDAPRTYYADPSADNQGWPTSPAIPIQWTPFPNRLMKYYGPASLPKTGGQLPAALSKEQVWEAADLGCLSVGGNTFPFWSPEATPNPPLAKVPAQACPDVDWTGKWSTFSPPGPRGWLDEYCEWAITYKNNDRSKGTMESIMFTCENPGYWLTLWQLDSSIVTSLYQQYVDPAVQEADLYLRYPPELPNAGDPVIDPTTGKAAYDPTNKWNGGPGRVGTIAAGTMRVPGVSGGAIHLTSPPNTLGAEIYLAAAATIQREVNGERVDPAEPQKLICCSQYGQNFRNSDPHIGAIGNQFGAKTMFSLTDPVGLYMQRPNFDLWETPTKKFKAEECWTVTRGEQDNGGGTDSILHAVVAIPAAFSDQYSLNDLKINGAPLRWEDKLQRPSKSHCA